ncbi:hypothetical protein CDAR_298181 [Caerostris darwini]|uniref:Uncharacterized protein n=1 Tax=Caerostris darwini TaxID=1538125 RepID=A0AAV4Q1E2_9ARAC|nr:hypothetical protein CDAR_298181 [Caerostris darwini]
MKINPREAERIAIASNGTSFLEFCWLPWKRTRRPFLRGLAGFVSQLQSNCVRNGCWVEVSTIGKNFAFSGIKGVPTIVRISFVFSDVVSSECMEELQDNGDYTRYEIIDNDNYIRRDPIENGKKINQSSEFCGKQFNPLG